MSEEIKDMNAEPISDELVEPDPNAKMILNTDLVELNGVMGSSFYELRDGETYAEYEKRTAHHLQRNAMFLWHCYKQSNDSWTGAYRLAPQLTCLGAICANDWLADMDEDEFDEIADLLPYDEIATNINEYEYLISNSPFFAKYAMECGETLNWLIDQFPDQGADWALETMYDETRKSFATNKIAGQEVFSNLEKAIAQAQAENEELPQNSRTIGISDVDEDWIPTLMMNSQIMPEIEQAREILENAMGNLSTDDDDEHEHPDFPEDENLELLWLQAYIWADRSWSKAEQFVSSIIFGAMSYAAAMFAPQPDFGEMSQEDRAKRIEELASQLMDENGNIALRQDETKQPIRNGNSISYQLDEISAEFMNLMSEQERFAQADTNNQNAMTFSGNLPACHDNVHGFLIEDIVDYISECEGEDDKTFEEDFNALSKYMTDRARSLGATAKSKWKKYLKANPEAAAAAKRREAIVQVDSNGNPVFISQVSHAEIGDPADAKTAEVQ